MYNRIKFVHTSMYVCSINLQKFQLNYFVDLKKYYYLYICIYNFVEAIMNCCI